MSAPGPQRQVAPSFFSNTWQIAGCALDNMAAILAMPLPSASDMSAETRSALAGAMRAPRAMH
jgi:hypothetical protein